MTRALPHVPALNKYKVVCRAPLLKAPPLRRVWVLSIVQCHDIHLQGVWTSPMLLMEALIIVFDMGLAFRLGLLASLGQRPFKNTHRR